MIHKYRTWRYWRDEWINPFIIAIVLAIIIRTFIVQPFKIPSTSMYPTLKISDRIFVNKFLYGVRIPFTNKWSPAVRQPKRGDIIVFTSVTDLIYPEPEKEYARIVGPLFFNKSRIGFRWYAPRYIVKRLIGKPGDKVEIKNGDVYINDKLLEKPVIIKGFDYFNAGDYGSENNPIIVPPGSYYVLGDNSSNSVDSRFWGFVPKGRVLGEAFIIWWPLSRIRLIK